MLTPDQIIQQPLRDPITVYRAVLTGVGASGWTDRREDAESDVEIAKTEGDGGFIESTTMERDAFEALPEWKGY